MRRQKWKQYCQAIWKEAGGKRACRKNFIEKEVKKAIDNSNIDEIPANNVII